jgi:hypothetical protein
VHQHLRPLASGHLRGAQTVSDPLSVSDSQHGLQKVDLTTMGDDAPVGDVYLSS